MTDQQPPRRPSDDYDNGGKRKKWTLEYVPKAHALRHKLMRVEHLPVIEGLLLELSHEGELTGFHDKGLPIYVLELRRVRFFFTRNEAQLVIRVVMLKPSDDDDQPSPPAQPKLPSWIKLLMWLAAKALLGHWHGRNSLRMQRDRALIQIYGEINKAGTARAFLWESAATRIAATARYRAALRLIALHTGTAETISAPISISVNEVPRDYDPARWAQLQFLSSGAASRAIRSEFQRFRSVSQIRLKLSRLGQLPERAHLCRTLESSHLIEGIISIEIMTLAKPGEQIQNEECHVVSNAIAFDYLSGLHFGDCFTIKRTLADSTSFPICYSGCGTEHDHRFDGIDTETSTPFLLVQSCGYKDLPTAKVSISSSSKSSATLYAEVRNARVFFHA